MRVNNPTLNRNIGDYYLPYIWDRVLFTMPELQGRNQHEQQEFQVHYMTLVPTTRSFVEESILCDTSTPRRIMENIARRPDEASLWGWRKLVSQGKIFYFHRIY